MRCLARYLQQGANMPTCDIGRSCTPLMPRRHVQERAQLNAEVARLREADAAAAAAKKSAAAALMREVDASNAAQLARREAAKAAAVEDDKVIARFIQERDAREQVTHCLLLLLEAELGLRLVTRRALLFRLRSLCILDAVGWVQC